MRIWNKTPMIRVLIPFLLGIISAVQLGFLIPFPSILFPLFFVVLLCIAFFIQYRAWYKYEWLFGVFMTSALFIAGYQCTWQNNETIDKCHYSHYVQSDSLSKCVIQIAETPLIKEKTVKLVTEVSSISVNGKSIHTNGHLLVYVQKDGAAEALKCGDKIAFVAKIEEPKAPSNPGEFDYKRILFLKNIHFQTYLNNNSWECIDSTSITVNSFFSSIQKRLFRLLDNDMLSANQKAVMGALVLGYTDDIDAEIIQSFSNTGLIHILSVSGMNVGLIYIVIELFFLLIPMLNRRRWVKGIAVITMLWLYALITGFSPSVVRAAMMFSFVVLGKTILRNGNIYNTLAGSAFLMLLFNPYLLFNIGFQLSYMAVIGIVCFQEELRLLTHGRYKLINGFWDIVTVTITAQLFTFPFCLFYFHQFPNYFLIANLLVIPVTTILIYLGIALMLVSPIPILSKIIALVINALLKFMFGFVSWVEGLPHAVSRHIPFSMIDLIMVLVLIALFVSLIKQRSAIYINTFFGVLVLWITLGAYQKYNQLHQHKFIIYSIKGSSALDFIQGQDHVLLSHLEIFADKKTQNYSLNNNWMNLGLKNMQEVNMDSSFVRPDINLSKRGHLIVFNKQRILFLDSSNLIFESKYAVKEVIDILLISKNAKVDLKVLTSVFNIKKVILDSSNSSKNTNFVIAQCNELGLSYYDILRNGAFCAEL